MNYIFVLKRTGICLLVYFSDKFTLAASTPIAGLVLGSNASSPASFLAAAPINSLQQAASSPAALLAAVTGFPAGILMLSVISFECTSTSDPGLFLSFSLLERRESFGREI